MEAAAAVDAAAEAVAGDVPPPLDERAGASHAKQTAESVAVVAGRTEATA